MELLNNILRKYPIYIEFIAKTRDRLIVDFKRRIKMYILFYEEHFLCSTKLTGIDSIKINTSRNRPAIRITAIPNNFMEPSIIRFVEQHADFLTENIIDHNPDLIGFRKIEFNSRLGIKKVQIALI